MEMLCPECLGTLVVIDERTVRCPLHGGTYQVLFSRFAAPAPAAGLTEAPPAAGSVCRAHPGVAAVYACARCGTPLCQVCAFDSAGVHLCSACMAAPASAAAVGAALTDQPALPLGVMCVTHPSVQAVATCKTCRRPLCPTCDFSFPGGVHLCPNCVTRSQGKMGDKRRRMLVWAYVLAAWATFSLLAMLIVSASGAFASGTDAEVFGVVCSVVSFLPAMVGMGLGVGSLDRRLGNPPSVIIAAVWNGLVLGVWLLLIVIGTISGG